MWSTCMTIVLFSKQPFPCTVGESQNEKKKRLNNARIKKIYFIVLCKKNPNIKLSR